MTNVIFECSDKKFINLIAMEEQTDTISFIIISTLQSKSQTLNNSTSMKMKIPFYARLLRVRELKQERMVSHFSIIPNISQRTPYITCRSEVQREEIQGDNENGLYVARRSGTVFMTLSKNPMK